MIVLVPDYCDLCVAAKGPAERLKWKERISEVMFDLVSIDQSHAQFFDPETEEGKAVEKGYLELYSAYKMAEVNCAMCVGDGCRIKPVIEEYIRNTVAAYQECCQLIQDFSVEAAEAESSNLVSADKLERLRRRKFREKKN